MTTTPTLDAVRERGALRAVVSRGIRGLSLCGGDGRWSGLDTDVARAVAAAVVGDGEAVEWVPSDPADRLTRLAAGDAELTVSNVSWTLGREASLPVLFAGVTCYDGEGFLVRADSGVTRPGQLAGQRVAVQAGTTSAANLAAWYGSRGWLSSYLRPRIVVPMPTVGPLRTASESSTKLHVPWPWRSVLAVWEYVSHRITPKTTFTTMTIRLT